MQSDDSLHRDEVTLEAPEQVELQFELAGLGSRFLAALIDTLLQAAVILAALLVAGYAGLLLSQSVILTIIIAASSLLFMIAYFIAFELLWSGQSPGKRVAGLVVMRTDGGAIGFAESAIRNILRLVDMLPVLYTFGLVSALVTSRLQRLGDLAAGTIVVKVREYELEQLAHEPRYASEEPSATETAGRRLVSRVRPHIRSLTPQEIETLKRFSERRYELDDAARERVAGRIARSLRHKFPTLSREHVPDPEAFLHIVYQAYLDLHNE